jgi:hypothetical protein
MAGTRSQADLAVMRVAEKLMLMLQRQPVISPSGAGSEGGDQEGEEKEPKKLSNPGNNKARSPLATGGWPALHRCGSLIVQAWQVERVRLPSIAWHVLGRGRQHVHRDFYSGTNSRPFP